MAIAKTGTIRMFVALLCLSVAAPAARAASSNASAQIIIIMPEREPADAPADTDPRNVSVPGALPAGGVPGTAVKTPQPGDAPMERSTTVIHDGDSIRTLHTEFAPL